MPRRSPSGEVPDWKSLCETAVSQGGYFTLTQAKEVGYSPQLLQHYIRKERVEREERGVYRLAYYPRGDQDDLILAWLWSKREGVISHDTALALHGLSDILPAKRHLSVSASWSDRKLRVPPGLVLHYGLPPKAERTWFGCFPITRPLRTLLDCQATYLSPDLLEQARSEGLERRLFTMDEIGGASSLGEEDL